MSVTTPDLDFESFEGSDLKSNLKLTEDFPSPLSKDSAFPTAQRHGFFQVAHFRRVIGRVQQQTWASKSEGLFSQNPPTTPVIFVSFSRHFCAVKTHAHTHTFLKCKTNTPR